MCVCVILLLLQDFVAGAVQWREEIQQKNAGWRDHASMHYFLENNFSVSNVVHHIFCCYLFIARAQNE